MTRSPLPRGPLSDLGRQPRDPPEAAVAKQDAAEASRHSWDLSWVRKAITLLGVAITSSLALGLLGLFSVNVPVSPNLTPWVYSDPCLDYYNSANGLLQRGLEEAVLGLDVPTGEDCDAPEDLVDDWRRDNDPCLDYYNSADGLLQRGLEQAVLRLEAPRGCAAPPELVEDWEDDNPPSPPVPGGTPCCPAVPVGPCPTGPPGCPAEGGPPEDPACAEGRAAATG